MKIWKCDICGKITETQHMAPTTYKYHSPPKEYDDVCKECDNEIRHFITTIKTRGAQ